ncbi:hypothetical protein [Variovorax sp. HJSM1_2]|uniref:hypothetical protein n=1 Tax=Variovorax sp. HJSM1_2 TaxID=3366263 RepID=UPI003BD572F0
MSGAFLVLWNSISSLALQPEYEGWHTFEHVPERVGLPGFIAARRYRSAEPSGQHPPQYFTCYWLEDIAALNTARYREVFAKPTAWSARMRSELRDFFRLPCVLRGSVGVSSASHLATLHLRAAGAGLDGLAPAIDAALAALYAQGGVVSAQWGSLQEAADFQIPITQEATLGTASQPGQDVVLMLHGLDQAMLVAASNRLLSTVQALAVPVSAPAFFSLLSEVRQTDLAHPLTERQPPWPDLFARFN